MATRGTPETRAAEAAEAARLLGARFRVNLDLGDGDLRTDRAAQLLVVEAVRRARPRLVLAPLAEDRHPDHERAGRLVPRGRLVRGPREARDGPPAAPARPGRLLRGLRAPSRRRSSWTSRRRSRRSSRRSARTGASSTPDRTPASRRRMSRRRPSSTGSRRARARYGRIANVEYAEGFVSKAPPDARGSRRRRSRVTRAERDERVKIGITCYPTFGGSGVVATELGHELARRGHDVHFITYAMPSRLNVFADRVTYHEVTVPSYPLFQYAPYDLALATRMGDVATHEGLDLIHVHYALPHAISAHLAREMLAPLQARPRDDAPRHGRDDRRARTARTFRSRASGSRSPTPSPRCPSTSSRSRSTSSSRRRTSSSSRTSSTPRASRPSRRSSRAGSCPRAGASSCTSRTSGP